MRARGAGNALRSGRRRRITHGGQCIEFSQSEQLLLQSHVLLRQPLALPPQERAVFLHVLQLRPVWCHIIRYTFQTIYIYIHISDKLFSVYWWSSRLASRCTRRKGVIACFGEHRIENRVITWLVEWSIYIYILTRTHTWPVCSGTKLLLAEDGDSAASLYQALRSDQWFREVRIHVKVGGKREQEMGRRSTIHTH